MGFSTFIGRMLPGTTPRVRSERDDRGSGTKYTYRVLADESTVCGMCYARIGGFEPPTVLRTYQDVRSPKDCCDNCADPRLPIASR